MRIQYDDDLVMVTDMKTKEVIYKGLEDYEGMKREDWIYAENKGLYELKATVDGVAYYFTKRKIG